MQIIVDNNIVDTKLIEFSDGTLNVWIDPEPIKKAERYLCLSISPDTQGSHYSLIINMVDNIISGVLNPKVACILSLDYLPNARADRVFQEGMDCPLESFMIDLWVSRFEKLLTKDVHNLEAVLEYAGEGIEVVNASQTNSLLDHISCNKKFSMLTSDVNLILCAPDKGASEKTNENAIALGTCFVEMVKDRDPKTGWIRSVKVLGEPDLTGKNVLITDDICDGGMTFLKCAEALRDAGANSVSLYVTHGIFSKGLSIFEGVIDNVFCHQIVMEYVTPNDIRKFNGGE